MRGTSPYITSNGTIYDIPKDEEEAFKADFGDKAQPAHNYRANGKIYSIPDNEAADFAKDFPDAEPIRRLNFANGKHRDFTTGELRKFMNGEYRTSDEFQKDREEIAAQVRERVADYDKFYTKDGREKPVALRPQTEGAQTSLGDYGDDALRGAGYAASKFGAALARGGTGAMRLQGQALNAGVPIAPSLVGGMAASYTPAKGLGDAWTQGANAIDAKIAPSAEDEAWAADNGLSAVGKVEETAGTILSFATAMKAMGLMGGTTLMSSTAGNDTYLSLYDQGIANKLSPEEANKYAVAGGAIAAVGTAAMAVMPLSRMLKIGKVPILDVEAKTMAGKAVNSYSDLVRASVNGNMKKFLANVGTSAGESAVIMGLQSYGTSLASAGEQKKDLADWDVQGEALWEGVKSAAEGAGIAAVLGGFNYQQYKKAARSGFEQQYRETLETTEGRDVVRQVFPEGTAKMMMKRLAGKDISRSDMNEAGMPEMSAAERNAMADAFIRDAAEAAKKNKQKLIGAEGQGPTEGAQEGGETPPPPQVQPPQVEGPVAPEGPKPVAQTPPPQVEGPKPVAETPTTEPIVPIVPPPQQGKEATPTAKADNGGEFEQIPYESNGARGGTIRLRERMTQAVDEVYAKQREVDADVTREEARDAVNDALAAKTKEELDASMRKLGFEQGGENWEALETDWYNRHPEEHYEMLEREIGSIKKFLEVSPDAANAKGAKARLASLEARLAEWDKEENKRGLSMSREEAREQYKKRSVTHSGSIKLARGIVAFEEEIIHNLQNSSEKRPAFLEQHKAELERAKAYLAKLEADPNATIENMPDEDSPFAWPPKAKNKGKKVAPVAQKAKSERQIEREKKLPSATAFEKAEYERRKKDPNFVTDEEENAEVGGTREGLTVFKDKDDFISKAKDGDRGILPNGQIFVAKKSKDGTRLVAKVERTPDMIIQELLHRDKVGEMRMISNVPLQKRKGLRAGEVIPAAESEDNRDEFSHPQNSVDVVAWDIPAKLKDEYEAARKKYLERKSPDEPNSLADFEWVVEPVGTKGGVSFKLRKAEGKKPVAAQSGEQGQAKEQPVENGEGTAPAPTPTPVKKVNKGKKAKAVKEAPKDEGKETKPVKAAVTTTRTSKEVRADIAKVYKGIEKTVKEINKRRNGRASVSDIHLSGKAKDANIAAQKEKEAGLRERLGELIDELTAAELNEPPKEKPKAHVETSEEARRELEALRPKLEEDIRKAEEECAALEKQHSEILGKINKDPRGRGAAQMELSRLAKALVDVRMAKEKAEEAMHKAELHVTNLEERERKDATPWIGEGMDHKEQVEALEASLKDIIAHPRKKDEHRKYFKHKIGSAEIVLTNDSEEGNTNKAKITPALAKKIVDRYKVHRQPKPKVHYSKDVPSVVKAQAAPKPWTVRNGDKASNKPLEFKEVAKRFVLTGKESAFNRVFFSDGYEVGTDAHVMILRPSTKKDTPGVPSVEAVVAGAKHPDWSIKINLSEMGPVIDAAKGFADAIGGPNVDAMPVSLYLDKDEKVFLWVKDSEEGQYFTNGPIKTNSAMLDTPDGKLITNLSIGRLKEFVRAMCDLGHGECEFKGRRDMGLAGTIWFDAGDMRIIVHSTYVMKTGEEADAAQAPRSPLDGNSVEADLASDAEAIAKEEAGGVDGDGVPQGMPELDEQIRREYDGVVAAHTNADGTRKPTWMKAPNGEPTRLTERQWVQVRTPAFKAWFGDWEKDPANASKVVDENGEPRVVYHGTRDGGFYKFDTHGEREYGTTGAWFSTEPALAWEFAGSVKDLDYQDSIPDEGSAIYATFLNIRNPFEYDFNHVSWDYGITCGAYADDRVVGKDGYDEDEDYEDYGWEVQYEDENGAKNYTHMYGHFFFKKNAEAFAKVVNGEVKEKRFHHDELVACIRSYVDDRKGGLENNVGRNWNIANSPKMKALLEATDNDFEEWCNHVIGVDPKNMMFDGFIYRNIKDGDDSTVDADQIIAFSPSQIKSATDNVGTFSAGDADIRYAPEQPRPKMVNKGKGLVPAAPTATTPPPTGEKPLVNNFIPDTDVLGQSPNAQPKTNKGKKKLTSRSAIFQAARELFPELLITDKGTWAMRTHLGHFEPDKRVVRVREGGAVSTLAHELGHAVMSLTETQKLKGGIVNIPLDVRTELVQMGRDLYGSQKPKGGGYTSEGAAEFIRAFLGNIDVSQKAPNVTRWFFDDFAHANKRNEDFVERLYKLRDKISEYANLEAPDKVRAFWNGERPVSPSEMPWYQKFLHQDWKTNWVDQNYPFMRMMKDSGMDRIYDWQQPGLTPDERSWRAKNHPYMLATFFQGKAQSFAERDALHGTVNLYGTRTGKGLSEILEPIVRAAADRGDKDFTKKFWDYIVAKRGLNYIESGLEPGLPREVLEKTVAEYDCPEFQEGVEEVTKWSHRILHLLVEGGAMSESEYNEIVDKNPVYVPFKRVFAEAAGDTTRASTGKAINKRVGGGQDIKDPLVELVSMAAHVRQAAQQAKLAQSIVAMYDLAMEKGAVTINKALVEMPNQIKTVAVPVAQVQEQIAKILQRQPRTVMDDEGEIAVTVDPLDVSDWTKMLDLDNENLFVNKEVAYKGAKKQIVTVYMPNGKMRTFEVVDPAIAEILKGSETVEKASPMHKVAKVLRNAIRAGATTLNAGFSLVANPIRDSVTAFVFDSYGKEVPFANTLDGAIEQLIKTDLAETYANMGGEMGRFFQDGLYAGSKEIAKSIEARNAFVREWKKGIVTLVGDALSIPEVGSRLNALRNARNYCLKMGMDREAANMIGRLCAGDVTIDFARAGKLARKVNDWILFLNAGIRSWEQLVRGTGAIDQLPWQFQGSREMYEKTAERLAAKRAKDAEKKGLPPPSYDRDSDGRFDNSAFDNMARKEAFKRTFTRGLGLTAFALAAYYMRKQDEEEYQKWKELKPSYKWMHITFGNVRLPIPFELGWLFEAVPVAIAESIEDNSSKPMTEAGKELAKQLPISLGDWHQLARNIAFVGPIVDVLANKNWAGSSIVPEWVKMTQDESDWKTQNTSIFAQKVSELLMKMNPENKGLRESVAPAYIDHLISGYTGNFANNLISGFESLTSKRGAIGVNGDWAKLPVLGRLFLSPFTSSRLPGEFYDEVDRLSRRFTKGELNIEELGKLRAMRSIDDNMLAVSRKQKVEALNSDWDARKVKEACDKYSKQIIDTIRDFRKDEKNRDFKSLGLRNAAVGLASNSVSWGTYRKMLQDEGYTIADVFAQLKSYGRMKGWSKATLTNAETIARTHWLGFEVRKPVKPKKAQRAVGY